MASYRFVSPTTAQNDQPFRTLEDPYPRGKAVPRVIGLTVFRLAGVWRATLAPTAGQLSGADRVYAGGHVHTVDQAAADELVAAGFGSGLTVLP